MFPENRRKAIKVRFPETVKGCKPLKGSIPKGLHPECSFHSRVPRRSFRSKDRWFWVIFRDRSVMGGQRNVKRRKEKRRGRWERDGPVSRGSSERTGEQASKSRQESAIARSVSLAPVSGWLRPTFLHLAGEWPLRFFASRLDVSFRRASPF